MRPIDLLKQLSLIFVIALILYLFISFYKKHTNTQFNNELVYFSEYFEKNKNRDKSFVVEQFDFFLNLGIRPVFDHKNNTLMFKNITSSNIEKNLVTRFNNKEYKEKFDLNYSCNNSICKAIISLKE